MSDTRDIIDQIRVLTRYADKLLSELHKTRQELQNLCEIVQDK